MRLSRPSLAKTWPRVFFTVFSLLPGMVATDVGALRRWQLHHYTVAPDQLRQRVAYSLGQILVTSTGKLVNANEIIPWIDLLNREAFGNYRDLLRDLTRSPSMGKYLDLANSMKARAGSGANENYPRELLQLFTIGLWELTPDGSRKLTVGGDPIPAYSQQTVSELARALTGWTYATAPGATPQNNNWEYFGAPMESRRQNHDSGSKTFLGTTIPAGQTVEQDLESTLDVEARPAATAPLHGQHGALGEPFAGVQPRHERAHTMAAGGGGRAAAGDPAVDGVGRRTRAVQGGEPGEEGRDAGGGGSDHGWGNHHLIPGGAVQGGRVYGTFPSMALGGATTIRDRGAR